MKSFSLTCLLFLGTLSGAKASKDGHPIEKVIKMLDGLKAKAIHEGQQEEDAFKKFQYWCKETTTALKDRIEEQTEKIEELEDLIAGKTKEEEVLETDIETLENEISKREAAVKKADEDREKEHTLYEETMKDLEGTIAAVDVALQALKDAEAKTEGGAAPAMMLARRHVKKVLALMSVYSSTSEAQLDKLRSFAAPEEAPASAEERALGHTEAEALTVPKERPDLLAAGDEAAHVDRYDFKSEGVIGLLKELKTKFQDEKLAATKAETNALNAHELAMAAQANAIKAATKSKDKKETTLAEVKAVLKEARENLEQEKSDKEADSKSLKDTDEGCQTKTSQWDERSKTRELEIEAMEQAKKILAKATGVQTEAPSNPVPPPSPLDFLQVASENTPKMAAVEILRKAAQSSHSRALERLAVEVQAHLSGPFDQVNNMIEKMIFRLMDEQKQEDEHKNWCDKELAKTNTMKDEKEDKLADLNAEIKSQTAKIAELTEEIKENMETIAQIVTFKKDATEVREVGKKENKVALAEAQLAQKALADAIAVLEDFYKESGAVKKEPWEFIQKPMELPEQPETWDSGYTGVADPKNQPSGILTVLENVMTDFTKMEAETKAQEAEDAKEYEQAMSDHDIEMARCKQEAEMKESEKKRRAGKVEELNQKKKSTQDELDKTNQYLKDLQPACVTGDSTYDDRKAARAEEIEALKKAQVILLDAFKEKPKEEAGDAPEGVAPSNFLSIKRHY